MAGGETLEILALRAGRWTIEATAASLDSARTEAVRIQNRAEVHCVRVIKESKKALDKLGPEDFLFEKLKVRNEGKVFVQPILDAPLCE